VVVLGLLLGLGAGLAASWRLGVSTDTGKLFAASLPWKQHQDALNRAFPQFNDLLVVVIDSQVPEAAEEVAATLTAELAHDPHVATIRRPDASPFFDRNGLLFLDRPSLEALLNKTIDAQPFLGQLVADPSARGLLSALTLVGMGVEHGQADLASFNEALGGFHTALAPFAASPATPPANPLPLSWEKLLGGGLADKAGPYHFVLIQPKLDYGALEPGGAATATIRAAAARLPAVQAGQVRVRITGSVALADEEFASVAQGAAVGLAGSLVLVILWLFLAMRSWRLVVPAVLTLLLGLMLTTGFAALAVGSLNLISVAFAILFVGIAVDFAIQFTVRFREQLLGYPEPAAALGETGRLAGGQIAVAALATAAGFLAFVPTAFVGVAELGLIAGMGMLIAFACTVLFLPACLALLRPREAAHEIGFRWAAGLDAALLRGRRPVLLVCGVLAVAGVIAVPRLQFDSDPLHTKNAHTEAMRTLADLMANPLTNPYSVDVLAANRAQADQAAARLRGLSLVDSVMTLSSFIPDDQPAKLADIADAAGLLAPTLAARSGTVPASPADLRMAVHTAADQLGKAAASQPAGSALVLLAGDLAKLQTASDATLLAMNQALVRYLPAELDRLRSALQAAPVTEASIPPDVSRDWLLPDGRVRVQATAKAIAQGSQGLHQFVAQITAVEPDAGGSAVTIVATSDTIISAFRTAAIGALVAIAVILLVALRRVVDAALVLAPLLFSALLTALLAVLLPLPLNFANIIALPLLLGVGVSFNIYFVMNWRAGLTHPLGSATARAVLFSALTTATAFGSLALSAHPGTASMGALLLLSLGSTLTATLILVPALLASVPRR
jgi:hopanoid biosynthesis associated RND transporter like protein HpnN